MLLSDGPPSSFRDIFKTYNWPHRPVRVFTYLIGDSSSSTDIFWMACANKGNPIMSQKAKRTKNNVQNVNTFLPDFGMYIFVFICLEENKTMDNT